MSDDHAADIDAHIRRYLMVFGALMVLTIVTVGVYYLDLSVGASIALALLIASVKASLVACFFMHLVSEKKLIYLLLAVTVSFFLALLFLPFLTEFVKSSDPDEWRTALDYAGLMQVSFPGAAQLVGRDVRVRISEASPFGLSGTLA